MSRMRCQVKVVEGKLPGEKLSVDKLPGDQMSWCQNFCCLSTTKRSIFELGVLWPHFKLEGSAVSRKERGHEQK